MMNSILSQLALNYVSSEQGQSSLIDLSRAFWRRLWMENKSLHTAMDINQVSFFKLILCYVKVSKTLSIDALQEKKYCQLLNSLHNTALEEKVSACQISSLSYGYNEPACESGI